MARAHRLRVTLLSLRSPLATLLVCGAAVTILRCTPAFLFPWLLGGGSGFDRSQGLLLLAMASALCLAHPLSGVRDRMSNRLFETLQAELEPRVWHRILTTPAHALRAAAPAELMASAESVAQYRRAFGIASLDVLATPLFSGLALAVLAAVAPQPACLMLVALVLLTAALTGVAYLRETRRSAAEAQGFAAQSLLQSAFAATDELRARHAMPAVLDLWRRSRQRGRRARLRADRWEAASDALIGSSLLWFVAAVVGAELLFDVRDAEVIAGLLAAVPLSSMLARYGQTLGAALLVIPVVRRLRVLPERGHGDGATASGAALLTSGGEHGDPSAAAVGRRGAGIRLCGVTHVYPDSNRPVLRDIDLTVRPGEFVAIVGRSGAGKTTLLRVLSGMEQPTFGRVESAVPGGRPVDEYRVAHVAEGTWPSAPDLGSFLADGPEEGRESDLHAAARLTGAAATLSRLPLGLRTPLHDPGAHFSSGEWQRLVLTRALLREPDLLVLDEATSVLEAGARHEIVRALAGVGTTRVMATHDMAVARLADRAIVLDDGRVTSDTARAAPATAHAADGVPG